MIVKTKLLDNIDGGAVSGHSGNAPGRATPSVLMAEAGGGGENTN